MPEGRRLARLQLEAQLHCRLGDNKQAIEVYRELFETHKVCEDISCHDLISTCALLDDCTHVARGRALTSAVSTTWLQIEPSDSRLNPCMFAQVESLELRTNVIAAYVCGGHAGQVPDIVSAMQISPSDSSEVGFNMACALLQLGSFAEAEEQLQLALRAGVSRSGNDEQVCPAAGTMKRLPFPLAVQRPLRRPSSCVLLYARCQNSKLLNTANGLHDTRAGGAARGGRAG